MLSPSVVPTAPDPDQQLKMRAGAGKLGWVLPVSLQEGRIQAHTWRPAGAGAPLPTHPCSQLCLKVPGFIKC